MGLTAETPIGRIFTMVEAAAALRISRRALQELIKNNPHYAMNGHKKLFSEMDIQALWECMRCPSKSSDAPGQTVGTYAAQSEAYLFSKVRALTTPQRRKPSASKGKARS